MWQVTENYRLDIDEHNYIVTEKNLIISRETKEQKEAWSKEYFYCTLEVALEAIYKKEVKRFLKNKKGQKYDPYEKLTDDEEKFINVEELPVETFNLKEVLDEIKRIRKEISLVDTQAILKEKRKYTESKKKEEKIPVKKEIPEALKDTKKKRTTKKG